MRSYRARTWLDSSEYKRATMALNWKSVKAAHVSQACETLSKSARPGPQSRGLIITYKYRKLSAKAVLRMAYCLANNMPAEAKLKFSSGEGTLQRLRSLGFQAERLPN